MVQKKWGIVMELRHLKYFVTVAEELNFTKAASRLNMSQPPLSQQIKQLENSIGVKLLERSNRTVELTDAGRAFLEKAYKILIDIEKAREYTRKIYKGEKGQLSIGFTDSALYDMIPIIQSYQSVNTEVDITMDQMSTVDQLKALQEEEIHIGFICTPIQKSNLHIIPIRKQKFVVVLPKSHKLAQSDIPINIQELVDDTFIVTPRKVSPVYYDTVMSIFHKMSFVPKLTITAHISTAVIALVSSGLGIALIPSSMKNLQITSVVFKELDFSPTIETSLAWRFNEKSHVVNSIVALVKQYIGENPSSHG